MKIDHTKNQTASLLLGALPPSLAVLLAFGGLCYAVDLYGWTQTWGALHLPTMYPPFADMRTVQGALPSIWHGFDPQLQNPGDPWGRPMNYPLVWIELAKIIHLEEEPYYLALIFVMLAGYVASCIWVAWKSQSFWTLLVFCSFSSLLLMERGNNDLAIIALLTLSAAWQPHRLGFFFIWIAACLKVYPGLAFAAFSRSRLEIALSITAGVLAFATFYSQLESIRQSTPVASVLSYGTLSILALFKKSDAWLVVSINVSICALAVLLSFKIKMKESGPSETILLLTSASVYVGTFLIGSNFDYRLAFLILTLPALSVQTALLKHGLPILILVAANQNLCMDAFGLIGRIGNIISKVLLAIIFGGILFNHLWPRIGLLFQFGKSDNAQMKSGE